VNFIVYFNSSDQPVDVTLPDARHGESWHVAVDTAGEMADGSESDAGATITVDSKSLLVLQEADGVQPSTDDSVDASLRAQNDQADGAAPAPRAELRTT
jgi:glycogen operon protein